MTSLLRSKIGATALAIAMFAVPATGQEVTLSALNFLPNNNSFGIPFAKWVEEVNADGKGVIQIAIKPAGTMSPFVMGNAVKTGVVDMANVPPTFYQNLLPIGDSLKLARKGPAELRKNGTWDLMNKLHNEKVNAWFLAQWGHGAEFYMYLREKKIDNLDLKGMKLRVTPVYRSFFRSLGADLIQTAPADVYTALERGTIDGYGWPIWDIKGFGWDKVTKYRVEPGFYEVANAIIINLDKWKSLSDAQRALLMKHGERIQVEFPKQAEERKEHYRKEQAAAGVQVITLTGKMAEDYLKKAYDAGWAEAEQLDPVNAPLLKKLIDK